MNYAEAVVLVASAIDAAINQGADLGDAPSKFLDAVAVLRRAARVMRAVEWALLPADHPVANAISHTLIFAKEVDENDILRAALRLRVEEPTP